LSPRNLTEKSREVIGEESYVEKVKSVFDGFPVFNTFNACVDIIDVNPNNYTGNKQVDDTTTTARVVVLLSDTGIWQ
jgi:hypothetical protein